MAYILVVFLFSLWFRYGFSFGLVCFVFKFGLKYNFGFCFFFSLNFGLVFCLFFGLVCVLSLSRGCFGLKL